MPQRWLIILGNVAVVACVSAACASVLSWKSGDTYAGARRPAGKARRVRISGIFERGATPPAGMPRPEDVSELPTQDTSTTLLRSQGWISLETDE